MGKVKVRLTHYSHVKGSEGAPGDCVEVDADRAESWIANNGAQAVADEAKLAKPAKPADK